MVDTVRGYGVVICTGWFILQTLFIGSLTLYKREAGTIKQNLPHRYRSTKAYKQSEPFPDPQTSHFCLENPVKPQIKNHELGKTKGNGAEKQKLA